MKKIALSDAGYCCSATRVALTTRAGSVGQCPKASTSRERAADYYDPVSATHRQLVRTGNMRDYGIAHKRSYIAAVSRRGTSLTLSQSGV
jgi:hypothetical protein